ncbi:MAG: amidase [Chloroflexota bacterium]|nr:amidase [Chloroflexota bacterium]
MNSPRDPVGITSDTDLCAVSATELAAAYRTRRLSPVEVTEAVLARIERVDPVLNAFVTVTTDLARATAREAEFAFASGSVRGPLDGVPVTIKDLVPTKGVRTTSGSHIYADHIPTEDAPIVERLRAGGAVILGKTTVPEFGWKSPTTSPLLGPTRNPWNPERTSAGSSGGAGVAVATGMGPLATGSDGGGSIRQPASFCGVVGLKPTFGLVPNYPPGSVETFGADGPMSRTVRDAAALLRLMAGYDPRDPLSVPAPTVDYVAACDGDLRGRRIAWSQDLGYAAVDPEVRAICEAAVDRFGDLGCEIETADPGWTDPYELFHTLFYGLVGGAVDRFLPEWTGRLDPGLEQIVEIGRNLTAFDVAQANLARNELRQTAQRFFERFDLLLTPTMTLPPFPIGIDFPPEVGGKPVTGMQWTAFTFPFNLTGQPAASVPAGWTRDGLPVGLQVVGRRWEDALVLRACAAFEAVLPWADRWPSSF